MSKDFNIKELTRNDWRDLGFYYESNEEEGYWTFTGSKESLSKLSILLRKYAENPRNNCLGELDHFGPYWYLKIITGTEPIIYKDGICGTPEELINLSNIIEEKLISYMETDHFTIDKEYSSKNEAILKFYIKGDNFDPASADLALTEE